MRIGYDRLDCQSSGMKAMSNVCSCEKRLKMLTAHLKSYLAIGCQLQTSLDVARLARVFCWRLPIQVPAGLLLCLTRLFAAPGLSFSASLRLLLVGQHVAHTAEHLPALQHRKSLHSYDNGILVRKQMQAKRVHCESLQGRSGLHPLC